MKKVQFKTPAVKADPAEAWVNQKTADVAEGAGAGAGEVNIVPLNIQAEPMKRFTIDVSESLHKRIKSQCAMRGLKMADTIRELLEQEFPEKST